MDSVRDGRKEKDEALRYAECRVCRQLHGSQLPVKFSGSVAVEVVSIKCNRRGVRPRPQASLRCHVFTHRRCSDPNQLTRSEKEAGLEDERGEKGKEQRGKVRGAHAEAEPR